MKSSSTEIRIHEHSSRSSHVCPAHRNIRSSNPLPQNYKTSQDRQRQLNSSVTDKYSNRQSPGTGSQGEPFWIVELYEAIVAMEPNATSALLAPASSIEVSWISRVVLRHKAKIFEDVLLCVVKRGKFGVELERALSCVGIRVWAL